MTQDKAPSLRRTIGKIAANSIAAWLAGYFYVWGSDAARKVPPERARKIAADRIGMAMGNLFTRPDSDTGKVL